MLESPFYEMIKEEGREEGLRIMHECVMDALTTYFGQVPATVADRVAAESDPLRMRRRIVAAVKHRDVAHMIPIEQVLSD